MSNKIWLSSPHMGGNELNYIHKAFKENWVAPLGPNVNEFEKLLENELGGDVWIAALSSGTAALHLALIQCGVRYGDEVICQSLTFSASANPILYQGAIPIFVDSETDTWNICPNALEIAIKERIKKGKKPKAIVAVHLYGMPFNVENVLEVANRYEIPLIEDAAEALGSKFKGKACGTFGAFGVLSFNGNKIITTSGGGALACRNKEDREKVIFFATQSRDDAPHYQHSHIGYNYRMSNICAGIGCGQMEVLSERVSARRSMNEFYKELFRSVEGIDVFNEPNNDYYSNHWLTAVTVDSKLLKRTSNDIRLGLLAKNIESRPLWKPMHLQPIFKTAPYYGGTVSEELFEKGLCLPSGSNLSDHEKEIIMSSISEIIR